MSQPISFVVTAQTLNPVFNPVVYYLDSTNKNEQNYRYIVDIYSATTADRIGSYRLLPEINTGYGVADVGQMLSSQISKDLFQFAQSFTSCTQDYFNYDLSIGEEYVYYWPFFDSLFAGPPFVGQTVLSSITSVNFFQSGDTVFVTGGTIPSGVYTVLDTPDAFSVVINANYVGGPLSGTPGTAVVSDYSNTVFFNLNSTGVTKQTAFNGAVAHQEFPTFYASAYTTNLSLPDERQFLTTVPQDYRVTLDNSMWLHFYNGRNGVTRPRALGVETSTGGYYTFNNPTFNSPSASTMDQVACGPADIINFTPTGATISGQSIATIFSGVEWYDVYLLARFQLIDLARVTEKKRFYINNKCFSYPNVELYFIDRLGSVIPANFQLKSIKSITSSKNQFTKNIGGLVNNTWTYDSIDAGNTTIGHVETEQLFAETDFLTESEMNFLRELKTSPRVYIKENGKLWPVIVNDTEFEITRKMNKKNFTCRVILTKANNNIINNING
jgi:hypothetical protein